MTNPSYASYLQQVVSCPTEENSSLNSPCAKVIVQDWVTLIGWGNPNAKVVFVGINPFYNEEAHAWHKSPAGITSLEHAKLRSSEGASHARHFSYHKRILRELRNLSSDLAHKLPNVIDDFAFFTEVAFCPSSHQGQLSNEIMSHCFEKNVKPFILEAPFQVVIALGRIPSTICVRSFIGDREADNIQTYHGRVFSFPNSNKFLLTSYHPNAFGKWDRSAISQILYDLHTSQKIKLV